MSSTPRSASQSPSPASRNALHNREDFALWAEAVRQQMLNALQKRQKA
ncbi:MAG: hypothetical protein ACHWZW_00700 [Spirulina sp.]